VFSQDCSHAFPGIAWSGLIAGSLDITSAFVIAGSKGFGPTRVLQGIASGLLGSQSFNGGLTTAVLGLILHFVIAFGAASLFYAASRKLEFLTRHAVVSGLAFGVAVYIFMNYIVLPLSAVKLRHHSVADILTAVLVLMVLFGLPISLITRRYSRSPLS
jgi:hypothetical protein